MQTIISSLSFVLIAAKVRIICELLHVPAKKLREKGRFLTFLRIFASGNDKRNQMNKVRITAIRQTIYPDLMAKYENPIEHTCDVSVGQQWISIDGMCPEGLCPSAWASMREFVEALARGEGNFYDGWMQNPMSAMISCNDGFRPFSFYLEVVETT